jgi:hypothetical protein
VTPLTWLAETVAEGGTGGVLLGVAAVLTAVAGLVTAVGGVVVSLRRPPARDDDRLAEALQHLLDDHREPGAGAPAGSADGDHG